MAKYTLKIFLKYIWPFFNIMDERVNYSAALAIIAILFEIHSSSSNIFSKVKFC